MAFLQSVKDNRRTSGLGCGIYHHFWPCLRVQTTITFCLLRGPLLPLLPLYSAQQPEQTFRNKSQIMFKTFYSLLISFRTKFKLPTVAVRLHDVALSLTSSYLTLLTHPVQLHCPSGCFSDTLNLFLSRALSLLFLCQIFCTAPLFTSVRSLFISSLQRGLH